jgi:hypothetical protein
MKKKYNFQNLITNCENRMSSVVNNDDVDTLKMKEAWEHIKRGMELFDDLGCSPTIVVKHLLKISPK